MNLQVVPSLEDKVDSTQLMWTTDGWKMFYRVRQFRNGKIHKKQVRPNFWPAMYIFRSRLPNSSSAVGRCSQCLPGSIFGPFLILLILPVCFLCPAPRPLCPCSSRPDLLFCPEWSPFFFLNLDVNFCRLLSVGSFFSLFFPALPASLRGNNFQSGIQSSQPQYIFLVCCLC